MFPFKEARDQPERHPLSKAVFAYRMRWKRRRLLVRSLRKRKQIRRITHRISAAPASGVLAFSTMRNEMDRIAHWLDYYRTLGVAHFLIVDNASDDGTAEYLAGQPDVSLWSTDHSYRLSRFGVDWLTCLQFRFGHGRWCLTVDADELLVFPDSGELGLSGLTEGLDRLGRRSFGAVMIDLYPKGPVNQSEFTRGADPLDFLQWFDAHNYRAKRHPVFGNLWIQGGVRARLFFETDPARAPTLNKTPLIKWNRRYVYVTSTHQTLPRKLDDVFSTGDRVLTSGVLLHTKFLPNVTIKSAEELTRKQHFENSVLYEPYYQRLIEVPDLWHEGSVRYEGSDQLEVLGLMTRGD